MPAPARLLVAALALGLLAATPALADDHDAQAWGNVTWQGPVSGKLLLWAEAQERFGDDVGRLSQSILRPGVGWQASKTVQLWAGYGRITNHNRGADVSEDRTWQQLSWNAGQVGGGTLTTRTRMEQRWVETGSDAGWRLRQLVKYSRPVKPGADLHLVAISEVFFALDDTDWGARSGFDQVRNFAGVGFSVAPKARLEVGYMNQYIERPGPNDRMNHIASFNLLGRF